MTALRPYQQRAFDAVRRYWAARVNAVCLVCPTGGGKTLMGSRLALDPGGDVLWVAHRTELVDQAAARLRSELSALDVDVVRSGGRGRHDARVHVGTVQTLLDCDVREPHVLVFDEAHHYVAESWSKLAKRWPSALILGLTATPERADGRPLGDMFSELVIAAQYSELIADGHLVETVTYRPPEQLQRALATDPIEAWQKHADGQQTFAFFSTIKLARQWAQAWRDRGVGAECIDAKTPKRERAEILARFSRGETRVLTNVHALTEGVDVPAASCVLLGRGFGHMGAYLQAVGRVLRPAPGKERATVIDLVGATHAHGFATEDRIYSLTGEGIRRETSENPVRNCLKCGLVYLCELEACPDCGEPPPRRVARPERIFSLELEAVWDGERTRDDAKAAELNRLMVESRARGWSLDFVVREYRKSFGHEPDLRPVATNEDRKKQLNSWRAFAKARGFKPQFAAARYRQMFGAWPGKL